MEISPEIKEMALYVTIALALVMIALCIGPIISGLAGYIPGVKITSSEATSYYIQALLAVVIAFITLKKREIS
ncbi:hypothetical protein [Methanosarcina sp. UBA5]|uniref:hypothetical protein n=1 Tax=Methanosarcina sp. UBA5 TaxID=1915593 RepID=UPI0025F1A3B9|nr:hypothetical protein [Methanosarcina sp. UBA5]